MTAESETNQAGAVSREMDWHSTDWRRVNQIVRRLQARIVKATQTKRWNKVKALQHLLTHSKSGKLFAVRQVTENSGKKTSGVDQVIWNTPEKKMAAVHNLQRRGYKPLPLKRVNIPKSNGKMRPLSIPTVHDRAMQALYLLALDPVAETTADPNSYGFRKERSTRDAIGKCFLNLCRKTNARWILEADILGCFDNLSHEWLLNHIPMDKSILRKWLKAGYLDKNILHPTETGGTPQGGIISPVLANLALDGLENKLKRQTDKQGLVNFVRYADDFIVTGRTKELLETKVMPIIEAHLAERGLELSKEKTRITHIDEGFDFLGQNVRRYKNGKMRTLLITPSKKNTKNFLEKVRKIIKTNPTVNAGILILLLNPVIRGWANYHRHIVSKERFVSVDSAIYQCLWQWAKRRHPMKSRTWTKLKYFHSVGADNWVFSGEIKGRDGEPKTVRLFSAASVPIKRHVKIKVEANPYDPAWETYFEQRQDVQMEENLEGHRKLLRLWFEQNGLCSVCAEKITKITGWHSHHIIYRVHGGTKGISNRVLLHPNCHRQVHSKGLFVEKPRFK